MGGWVSNLVLSYNLSHSPTPTGWLHEGDAHPQERGRSGWEQAAKVCERQGSPLGPVLPAKAGLSCCWSHGDSLFIFAIRWASNAVPRRQNKRKKGKLKSSLGQTVMEVHCSMQGYTRATKMVFNSPNRSGLGRGWGRSTPTLTHPHSVQNRGRHCRVGCPGLGRCSGLHEAGPEVTQRCHNVAQRGAFGSFLQQKEKANTTCQHRQYCWLSVSKTKMLVYWVVYAAAVHLQSNNNFW